LPETNTFHLISQNAIASSLLLFTFAFCIVAGTYMGGVIFDVPNSNNSSEASTATLTDEQLAQIRGIFKATLDEAIVGTDTNTVSSGVDSTRSGEARSPKGK
jgi:hypothetical protein